MNRTRFRIRDVLKLTAVIALVLGLLPTAVRWLHWSDVEEAVDRVFVEAAETKNKSLLLEIEINRLAFQLTNDSDFIDRFENKGRLYESSTRSFEIAKAGTYYYVDELSLKDAAQRLRKKLFVSPPGKWASTPEEVIQLIKDNL